jgi:hypothetical protein
MATINSTSENPADDALLEMFAVRLCLFFITLPHHRGLEVDRLRWRVQ